MLSIWPAFPIVVSGRGRPASLQEGADNIVAALGHNNRLCEIDLREVPSSLLERLVAVMMEPSPELTSLVLCTNDDSASIVPDLFLGGSTPRLHTLRLDNIPFPALRKLLLSATDLVYLHLWNIPHSGYISPEAMVTCLATMTRLQRLYLGFRSPRSHPDRASQPPPPLIRAVLPALTYVFFRGCSEYLENLVAWLDAPILDDINVTFFNRLIFDIPQLLQFLCRAENFKALDRANVVFRSDSVRVTLSMQTGTTHSAALALGILCTASDWQLSALAQRLDIREGQDRRPRWQYGVENGQWLELLSPFAAVETLYLSEEMASHVAPALDELAGESVLDGPERPYGPVEDCIFQFLTARQQSGYPVAFRHR
ncbi:hypothetical protein BC826DRAFT_1010664 [Russula brevipes]|nr:hypothetical protein BC826DRAFT_1010664 [Russula brevipes]